MTANRYLCIHGHFYQPPRENPWLETIDYQESARPYHDWNERISAECYRANGLSRILDSQGWVVRLSNNYSRINFNFGPTLLSWMQEHDPQAYASILEGDRLSIKRFGGHGSAIAQAYNHIIMPLANRRDKITQIKWGLYDFENRFGRSAESMWLPETAVDFETLEIMADHGMKYVILAPRQAQAVRPVDGDHLWQSVRGEQVDTRMAYKINLPNGNSISAFFYNGELSRAVAFEGLLNNGEVFATRLCNEFDPLPHAQLMHIATDGESYGHHHLRGDMALAYALEYIEKHALATLINYGQYLELFPPTHEALIYENSSWSCIHGIERWRHDCGCNSGGHPAWNQKWRAPLRAAMDNLRDELAPCFEKSMEQYTDDCWEMRDDYIRVISSRSLKIRQDFLRKWVKDKDVTEDIEISLLKLLEAQRNLLLMYTSCAWFFDEISGVESVQVMEYAAKAIELTKGMGNDEAEANFLHILQTAPSNIPEFVNGRLIFELMALPSRMDFLKIAAHLGAQALFHNKESETIFGCYDSSWLSAQKCYSGHAQLIIAHVKITSRVTREARDIEFVAVHLGDHNINIGAHPYSGKKSFDAMAGEFSETFGHGDMSKSLRLLDKYFEGNIYYLEDLCHEQQREIIDNVFSQTLQGLEEQFTSIYDRYYAGMSYLSKVRMNLPQVFLHIAHFVQNKHIQKQLNANEVNFEEIERYVFEAKSWNVELDPVRLGKSYIEALSRALKNCMKDNEDIECVRIFKKLVELQEKFPFTVDLGEIQNAYALWRYQNKDLIRNAEWRDIDMHTAEALKIRIEEGAHDQ